MGERICSFDGLDLREEQLDILNAVREFVDNEIIPVAHDLEARDEYPEEIVQGLREMGLFGMRIPEQYGGLGPRPDDLRTRDRRALARLDVGRRHRQRRLHRERHARRARHAGAEGSATCRRSLRASSRCCFMMTEPEAGSDVRAIRTTARREGDELVVNGQKMWVTNGARAGLMALLVKTDPTTDPPQAGMTALIVEKDAGRGQAGRHHDPAEGRSAEARLQGRRVDRDRVRRPPRAGVDDPRRAGGRGPGLLPDDERHRDRPHQRRRARPGRRAARLRARHPLRAGALVPSASRSPSTS